LSPKYRFLLAALLTMLAIYSQAVFGQTKKIEKIVQVSSNTLTVKVDNLQSKDCTFGPGAISITPTGGSGNYVYSWTGPSGFVSTQQDISNLEAGVYSLSMHDGKGCIYSNSWTISSTCSPACNLLSASTISNATACNTNDGAISVNITGGSGTYGYTWYNNNFTKLSNSKDLTGVPQGSYYLEVADNINTGCTTFFYYYVESSFKVNYTTVANTKCAPSFTGSISVSVAGGSGNYTYQWQNPSGTTIVGGATLSGIRGGGYTLRVTDNTLGCSIEKNIYLSNSSAATLAVSEVITPSTACKPGNGGVNLTVSGGSGDYTYAWYNQANGQLAGAVEDLEAIGAATYNVNVIDNTSGCNTSKQIVVPDQTTKPQFTTTVTSNTRCTFPFDGAINLTSSQAGSFDVLWSNGATTEDISAVAPGTYGVSVTDMTTGCKTEISAGSPQALVVADQAEQTLNVSIDAVTGNSACSTPNGSIQLSVQSTTAPSIVWTGPNGFTSTQEDLTGLPAGDYLLTATIQCNLPPVIQSQELTTATNSTLRFNLLDVISDPDDNLNLASIEIIEAPASGAIASITNDVELSVQYKNSFKGTDQLRIRACDLLNACTDNVLSIEVALETEIIVYNAVAPNSVGDNKFMRIDHLPNNNRVSIFNRWGDKVFEVQNYESEVPGKRFEGLSDSGKALPTGTYFYKIELASSHDPLTGYLSLKQ